MSHHIPDEDLISKIILRVLQDKNIVGSQAELTREVLKHLKRYDSSFTVSGKRLRKIALKIPSVHVEIRCKNSHKIVEDMKICPVCGEKMEKIENMTLEGEKITMGFRCPSCPYWTGKNLRIPSRYIFKLI